MSDNLDTAWVQRAEGQTEDVKPQPGLIGEWLDELEENQMPVHCQLCDEPIDYPFGENWIAWCRKCARNRWEEVMVAIMRLRDDG